MADEISRLVGLANRFNQLDENYVTVNSAGAVDHTTTNAVGRFFKRLVTRMSSEEQRANQQTIAALKQQFRSDLQIGDRMAKKFSELAAKEFDMRKPLSGRQISKVLIETLESENIHVFDQVGRAVATAVDGKEGVIAQYMHRLGLDTKELDLGDNGLTTDFSAIAQTSKDVYHSMERWVLSRAFQRKPENFDEASKLVMEEGMDAVRSLVMRQYLNHDNSVQLFRSMNEKYGIEETKENIEKFDQAMMHQSKELGDWESLDKSVFERKMEAAADDYGRKICVSANRNKFFTIEDSPDSFNAAYRKCVEKSEFSGANVNEIGLTEMAKKIGQRYEKDFGQQPPSTDDEMIAIRETYINDYLNGLSTQLASVTDNGKRLALGKAFASSGQPINADFLEYTLTFSQAVVQTLDANSRLAGHAHLRESFKTITSVGDLVYTNLCKVGKGGEDDRAVLNRIAFMAGLTEYTASKDSDNPLQEMTRLGSPYIDYAYIMKEEVGKGNFDLIREYSFLIDLYAAVSLQSRVTYDPQQFGFTDLSLERKKELAGNAVTGQGFYYSGLDNAREDVNRHLREYLTGRMNEHEMALLFTGHLDGSEIAEALHIQNIVLEYLGSSYGLSEYFATLGQEADSGFRPSCQKEYDFVRKENGIWVLTMESIHRSTLERKQAIAEGNPAGFHYRIEVEINPDTHEITPTCDFIMYGWDE